MYVLFCSVLACACGSARVALDLGLQKRNEMIGRSSRAARLDVASKAHFIGDFEVLPRAAYAVEIYFFYF